MDFKEFRHKYQGKCAKLSVGGTSVYLYIQKVFPVQIFVTEDFKCILQSLYIGKDNTIRQIKDDTWYLNDRLFHNGTFTIVNKSEYKSLLRRCCRK